MATFDDGKEAGALRTIGEVAKATGIKAHVLRYWEQQFPMLKPLTRSGGRRRHGAARGRSVERDRSDSVQAGDGRRRGPAEHPLAPSATAKGSGAGARTTHGAHVSPPAPTARPQTRQVCGANAMETTKYGWIYI